jgi:hypothetical protein
MSTTMVTGVFESRSAAETAVHELERRGFGANDITLMVAEGTGWTLETKTKAPEGAIAGAATGGLLGALIAGLTSVGVIGTGGIGILATGPLVAALAGAGAGGSAGGIVGGLIGAGMPELEAEFIEQELGRGRVLLGVRARKEHVELAEDILQMEGAASVKVSRV